MTAISPRNQSILFMEGAAPASRYCLLNRISNCIAKIWEGIKRCFAAIFCCCCREKAPPPPTTDEMNEAETNAKLALADLQKTVASYRIGTPLTEPQQRNLAKKMAETENALLKAKKLLTYFKMPIEYASFVLYEQVGTKREINMLLHGGSLLSADKMTPVAVEKFEVLEKELARCAKLTKITQNDAEGLLKKQEESKLAIKAALTNDPIIFSRSPRPKFADVGMRSRVEHGVAVVLEFSKLQEELGGK